MKDFQLILENYDSINEAKMSISKFKNIGNLTEFVNKASEYIENNYKGKIKNIKIDPKIKAKLGIKDTEQTTSEIVIKLIKPNFSKAVDELFKEMTTINEGLWEKYFDKLLKRLMVVILGSVSTIMISYMGVMSEFFIKDLINDPKIMEIAKSAWNISEIGLFSSALIGVLAGVLALLIIVINEIIRD